MNRHLVQRIGRSIFRSRPRQRAKVLRPTIELLENRQMLDGGGGAMQLPAAIVVRRTLATPSTAASSTPSPPHFVGEAQGNQVTITYTAYSEQANPQTG